MTDYISREAALNVVGAIIKVITPIEESRDIFFHDSGRNAAITGARIELEKLPVADVAPVVHARWERKEYQIAPFDVIQTLVCSNCGYEHEYNEWFNGCPNCFARMDAEVEE